jgi:hypothetical protein
MKELELSLRRAPRAREASQFADYHTGDANGLNYSRTRGFGTAQAPSFFNLLQALEGGNSSLASPTGFKPVLPL